MVVFSTMVIEAVVFSTTVTEAVVFSEKIVGRGGVTAQASSIYGTSPASMSQQFDGSMSRRIDSTSSRRRNPPPDSTAIAKQVPENLENIMVKKFILIHDEGFGAWCWYKKVALLEESGLLPTAIDLTGSGINLADTNGIATLADYSKPLTDYLENVPHDEKVILVGHSTGGACISYALEHFPHKILKAIFVCATMVFNEQRPFDVFAEEVGYQ